MESMAPSYNDLQAVVEYEDKMIFMTQANMTRMRRPHSEDDGYEGFAFLQKDILCSIQDKYQ